MRPQPAPILTPQAVLRRMRRGALPLCLQWTVPTNDCRVGTAPDGVSAGQRPSQPRALPTVWFLGLSGVSLCRFGWHGGCVPSSQLRGPFPDNGTPVARRGRKATGQDTRLTAGLPKEGSSKAPREQSGLPRHGGVTLFFRRPLAHQLHLPSSYAGVCRRYASSSMRLRCIFGAGNVDLECQHRTAARGGLESPLNRGRSNMSAARTILAFGILLLALSFAQHAFAVEPMCPGGTNPNLNVIMCSDFETGTGYPTWSPGAWCCDTNGDGILTAAEMDFVICGSQGFQSNCAAWTNRYKYGNQFAQTTVLSSGFSEIYARWYGHISSPFNW